MTTHEKVIIDQSSLTFEELADIEETMGSSLSGLFESSQARAMAALVWITKRRTDPTFTFQQAMKFGPANIENLDNEAPEAPGANGGATQPTSHASGGSAPPT